MRQTLFFIPLPEPALMVAVWLLVCALWIGFLARRQGWNSDTLGFVPLAAIVAAVLYFVLPNLAEEGLGVPIRGYGVMLLIAVVTGVGLAVYRARRAGVDAEIIYSLAFWLFLAGIVGARLFFVLQYHEEFLVPAEGGGLDLAATVQRMFNVTRGGLVVYGSFLGGVAAYALFVYRRKLPPLELADLIAPSMVIGLAIGRIGCLLNGCCFGGVCYTELPAITFPAANPPAQPEPSPPYLRQLQLGQLHGFTLAADSDGRPMVARVRAGGAAERQGLPAGASVTAINGRPIETLEAAQVVMHLAGPAIALDTDAGRFAIDIGQLPPRSQPVHPAQIYSAVNGLLIFLFLWFYYPFRQHEGEVFALLITIYPITRIMLEWVRIDEPGMFGTPLTISQWTSMALLLAAAVLWTWVLRQPRLDDRSQEKSAREANAAVSA